MVRVFLFLIGLFFSVIGLVYIISYLNLFSLGYNFKEYGDFICSRVECIVGLIGIVLIFLSIFFRGKQ